MSQIWTIVISACVTAAAVGALLSWRRDGTSRLTVGIVLGTVSGLVATVVVLQPRVDLIPDEIEGTGVVVVIVLVSLALIVMTWFRWYRE